jgi:hypothetical protein
MASVDRPIRVTRESDRGSDRKTDSEEAPSRDSPGRGSAASPSERIAGVAAAASAIADRKEGSHVIGEGTH